MIIKDNGPGVIHGAKIVYLICFSYSRDVLYNSTCSLFSLIYHIDTTKYIQQKKFGFQNKIWKNSNIEYS